MAKLNGVSVVAESIVYDGVTYVKTDEQAQAGDIVRMDETSSIHVTEGEYYEVITVDSVGDAQISDNDGDDFDTVGDTLTVFRRVESAVVDEADVITHDGVKYRKVAREAKVGENIVITAIIDYAMYDMTVGKIYEVVDKQRVPGDPFVNVIDDKGDEASADNRGYAVLERIEPVATQYTEVKRKADVGERIRIVAAGLTFGMYDNGSELVVDSTDYSGVYVKSVGTDGNRSGYIGDEEYVVLEPTKASANPAPLKVGDYAILTSDRGSQFEIGDVVKITEVDAADDIMPYRAEGVASKGHDGSGWDWLRANQVVRATDTEVAAAQRKAEPSVKVGDYVRITQNQTNWPEGTIVKVTEVGVISSNAIRATDGKITRLSNKFEPVTPAEAEAARKQAEEAEAKRQEERKWAAIGRKVGEYKVGDIVKGFGRHTQNNEIGAVEDISDRLLGVRRTDGYSAMNRADVTLIAPVESLFNAN